MLAISGRVRMGFVANVWHAAARKVVALHRATLRL